MNALYYGDNLDVLRQHVADESVDLVYLDPPFNSNRSYNVLFKNRSGDEAQAQIEAFDDTWTWSQQSEAAYRNLAEGGAPLRVADAVEAMRRLLGDNDVLAYLVMMAGRLVELHRVLKSTGSLYLHCDPTASHYLKVLLDAVFGPTHFRNEVIWKRTHSHGGSVRYGPVHDTILFYSKSDEFTWTSPKTAYSEEYVERFFKWADPDGRRYRSTILTGSGTRRGESGKPWGGYDPTAAGRHWAIPGYVRPLMGDPAPQGVHEALDRLDTMGRMIWPAKAGVPQFKQYLDDMEGVDLQDIWTDLPPIHSQSHERLGYPTQKPLALLERIILASSRPGDVVLDPFCGCGTAVDAAQKLDRRWIGIDITYLAVDLISKRLRHTYGDAITSTYEVFGIPRDLDGAEALFDFNPFEFERWAVSQVDGQPNQRQVGDKGIDGVIRFPLSATETGRIIVSVKGGKHVNPAMVQELAGALQQHKAAMGVFICMTSPTRGMVEAANHSGSYEHPLTGATYPKVQMITVGELLEGRRPKMPTPILPYVKARARRPDQPTLDL